MNKTIISEVGEIFDSVGEAILELQLLQNYLANRGYSSGSYLDLEAKKLELIVYIKEKQLPKIPWYHKYTFRVLNSFTYWSAYTKKVEKVRSVKYLFEIYK